MRVPAGVPLVVETVKVEVSDPEIEAGLKLAVTPAGAPRMFAERVTVPVKPFPAVSEITLFWSAPAGVSGRSLGDAESVKYGFVVEVGARAAIVAGPSGVPQPVARSYPIIALKPSTPDGSPDWLPFRQPRVPTVQDKLLFSLQPVVMSWR
jgi:hypothetical protein